MKQTITTYEELDTWVRAFAQADGLRLLVLVGTPGLSKSYSLKTHLPPGGWYVKAGKLTAFQLYLNLYAHRDEPIVLDDVDPMLKDTSAVRILMAACETDERSRKVGWYGTTSQLTVTNKAGRVVRVPQEFKTDSRFAIVCNDWELYAKKLSALEDRGYVIFFEPSVEEVHRQVGTWFGDREIYDFCDDFLDMIPAPPTIRYYGKAAEMKALGMDWRAALWATWTQQAEPKKDSLEEQVAREVCADPAFPTRKDQCEEWMRRTGRSRPTFFRAVKRLGL